MTEIEITPYPNGPFLVRGPIRLWDENGNEVELRRRTVAICRCGRSRIHPFCDGTHKVIGFKTESAAQLGVRIGPARDDLSAVPDAPVTEPAPDREPRG